MALSLPPFDLHFLAWFALVPWLLALPRLSSGSMWVFASCLGLVFYRISLSWLFGIHPPLAGITVVVLSVLMGLCFRVSKLLEARLGSWAMWWSIPFVFAGQEILRSEGLSPWRLSYGAFGYSQAGNLWIAQIASVGGVYSLSFLLVASNAAVAYALVRPRLSSLVPSLVMSAMIVGLGILAQPPKDAPRTEIPVACVQAETQDDREYVALTRQAADAAEKPVIIVLPEHAIEGYANRPHRFVDQLAAIARECQIYLCVGAHLSAPPGLPCDYDNVALLIGPDGGKIGAQAKSVPLPFADDGNPAGSLSVFQTRFGCIGMCVCFDADFTDVPRRIVDLGAELLLVPVMNPDRWPIQQRLQQAQMARIRSIELRRHVIRAASSGVSQIVNPEGHIRSNRTQAEGPGVLFGKVCLRSERTIFVRGGHYFATTLGVSFVIAVVSLTLAQWFVLLFRRNRTSLAGKGSTP